MKGKKIWPWLLAAAVFTLDRIAKILARDIPRKDRCSFRAWSACGTRKTGASPFPC